MSNKLVKEMIQYEKDLAWVIDNYDILANQYAEKYVAVLNFKVIEHASEIEDLQKKLEYKFTSDLPHILVEFIYKTHPNFVL